MTEELALNDPPMPTGWEPIWMLPAPPLPWPKPIDPLVDESGQR